MKYPLRFLSVLFILLLYLNTESVAQDSSLINGNIILQTTASWDGNPIIYPEGEAQITALHIEIPSGAETGWHSHPVPSFGYVLEGTLEIAMEDGSTLIVNKGEALAEVTSRIHSGKSIGENSLKLVVFYAGVTDKDLTIMDNVD